MKNRRENPKRFIPMKLKVYENAGGGFFRCQYSNSEISWMQNVNSGWCCRCHGIVRYEDGTIEWDYSTGGHFEPLPEAELNRQEFLQKLGSLTNAMLCCAI